MSFNIPGVPGKNPLITLLQQITGANKPQPMDERIPGQGNPINPASPDPSTVLGQGPLTQNTSVIPGAGIPPVKREYPDVRTSDQEFRTVSGNKRIAFNNMFTNAASIITTHNKNKEAQESRMLAVDLERLLTAAQNPNDPANQQIITDMLSDKKKAKRIQEALDIKFMGEDERDPVVKKALDSALQKLKGSMGTPQFEQNLSRMLGAPTMPTLTPEIQAKLALIKGGALPKAEDLLKAHVDWNKFLSSDATKIKVAQILATTRDNDSVRKLLAEIPKNYRAELMANAQKYRADKMLEGVQKRVEAIVGKGGGEKGLTQEESLLLRTIQAQTKELQAALKTEQSKWWKDNTKIKDLKDKLDTLHNNADQLRQKVNKRVGLLMGGDDGNNDTGAKSGTGGSSDDNFDADKFLQDFKDITGDDNE